MYPCVCQDHPGLGGILYGELCLAVLHSTEPASGKASCHRVLSQDSTSLNDTKFGLSMFADVYQRMDGYTVSC